MARLIRRTPLRRIRMRRVGKKGRTRMKRLEAIRPLLEARSGGRCELPWCRSRRRPLEMHHIVKRSQGGSDDPATNLLYLCHRDHARLDLPATSLRHLGVERFQDDLGRWFALFVDGDIVQNVPLAVPLAIPAS